MTTNNTIPILHLHPGKDEPMERRHPWVFSGALDRRDTDGLMEGDVVELRSSKDDFVARGYWSPENIAIRILTFDVSEQIDQAFWTRRLREALEVREVVGLAREHAAFRWVYGEGDGLPGLVIDQYDTIAVMQAHTLGIHRQRHMISEAMSAVLGSRLQVVYYKSAETLSASAPIEGEIDELLMGTLPKEQEVVIDERGMKFYLDVVKGQKTGFFLDQRDNRSLLRQYAKGRKVLNMFCYTGGFSLAAMLGEAKQVVSVDSSERAIDLTARNMELNFPGRDDTHEEIATDAFGYLEYWIHPPLQRIHASSHAHSTAIVGSIALHSRRLPHRACSSPSVAHRWLVLRNFRKQYLLLLCKPGGRLGSSTALLRQRITQ